MIKRILSAAPASYAAPAITAYTAYTARRRGALKIRAARNPGIESAAPIAKIVAPVAAVAAVSKVSAVTAGPAAAETKTIAHSYPPFLGYVYLCACNIICALRICVQI